MLGHAYYKGLLHRPTPAALCNQNALRLEPEQPINVSLPITTRRFAILTI